MSLEDINNQFSQLDDLQESLISVKYTIQKANMSKFNRRFNSLTNYHNIFKLSNLNKRLIFLLSLNRKRSKILLNFVKSHRSSIENEIKQVKDNLKNFNETKKIKITLREDILRKLLLRI